MRWHNDDTLEYHCRSIVSSDMIHRSTIDFATFRSTDNSSYAIHRS
ncbi:hypothetical protein RE6C_02520 [Rhodopirellula europaea 6C]|uniref:Uncharacterized protein n=1 Tax=Rhodopirellula europaea 6C TaxID=1263867 RepID=M2AHU0_9BACT|nr:hypothetical protein RE6C_02520 [Rhodopirellula europaea 6C]